MKIFVLVNNYFPSNMESPQGWYILADSAMTNTGKPFFLPENPGEVTASLGLGIKISRLGKHVDAKFADRYYTEWAPMVHFVLKSYENKLKTEGLPLDPARNFDRALFVGDFQHKDELKDFQLYKDGKVVADFSILQMVHPINEIIKKVSELNTLKIGDVIVAALTQPINVETGDFFEVKALEERLFHVKVK